MRPCTMAAVAMLTAGLLVTGCGGADPRSTVDLSTAATTTPTACTIPERFRGLDLERLPVSRKLVALTFDAGANADGVWPILETLDNRNVPATFFLTGRFVQNFPDRSRRIAREHLVGNHTMTHPDLTTLTRLEIRAEVRSAEHVIRERTGEDPRRFFRFPFGARDARTIRIVNDLCYVAFRWTVDTHGWQGTSGGRTAAEVIRRVLAAAQPGEIVLMHVGSHPTDHSTLDADALGRVIRRLRVAGCTFVPLSRVMSEAP
jgi:peptidoglycan/xylan/chitin deacetylase (PgdA/CDA1 family)